MKNEYTVYFLYDTSKTLLYIGKTTSIRERIAQHISRPLMEKESWRKEINLDDILLYYCRNKCDMEIYETYFINKYKPKYNRDKVYGVRPSFKLPYLESTRYTYNPNNTYTEQFLEYIKLRDSENPDLESIAKYELEFPIFKKHYENEERKEIALDSKDVLEMCNSLRESHRLHFIEDQNEFFKHYHTRWDSKKKLMVYK